MGSEYSAVVLLEYVEWEVNVERTLLEFFILDDFYWKLIRFEIEI